MRLLVENSLQMFINMVETPCLPCLPVEDGFVWGNNLICSPFLSQAPPIFSLILKMDENGAYYSTTPELFAVSYYYIIIFFYSKRIENIILL